VLTRTDTRRRRCCSSIDTLVYINFTQEKIIYQSCWCIQMRFKFPSIFSARCFTFKTISFSHCWWLLSLDMRPTCFAPPSIIHFPLCPGFLARSNAFSKRRSSHAAYIEPSLASFFVWELDAMVRRVCRGAFRCFIVIYEINQAIHIIFCFTCASCGTLYIYCFSINLKKIA